MNTNVVEQFQRNAAVACISFLAGAAAVGNGVVWLACACAVVWLWSAIGLAIGWPEFWAEYAVRKAQADERLKQGISLRDLEEPGEWDEDEDADDEDVDLPTLEGEPVESQRFHQSGTGSDTSSETGSGTGSVPAAVRPVAWIEGIDAADEELMTALIREGVSANQICVEMGGNKATRLAHIRQIKAALNQGAIVRAGSRKTVKRSSALDQPVMSQRVGRVSSVGGTS